MSDGAILSGTGNGRRAKVNRRNELDVLAFTISEEARISQLDGQSFFLPITDTADTLTLATGNTYNILYLKNTSSRNIIVEKVLSSSDTAGCVMTWVKNPTLGTVGANNTATPQNLNFGSNNEAVGTFHVWDETGTSGITGLSGGTKIKTFITGVGFTIHPIDGAIIIPNGNSMLIQCTNSTGGNVEWECGVRMYYDTEDL